ncbi:unnamed protein product, partial [Mycena citricolor]
QTATLILPLIHGQVPVPENQRQPRVIPTCNDDVLYQPQRTTQLQQGLRYPKLTSDDPLLLHALELAVVMHAEKWRGFCENKSWSDTCGTAGRSPFRTRMPCTLMLVGGATLRPVIFDVSSSLCDRASVWLVLRQASISKRTTIRSLSSPVQFFQCSPARN